MQKIIFLDFDGVLTSEAYTRQCVFEYRQENLYGIDWFDPTCIGVLETVVERTDASVVVSSDWRELGEEKLRRLWEELRLPGILLGTTPLSAVTKREAVLQWLEDNDCRSYVVIDDDDLNMERQFRTSARTGLKAEDIETIMDHLNR